MLVSWLSQMDALEVQEKTLSVSKNNMERMEEDT